MRFSSPQHALRWAYETSNRPIVKISSVNDMREASRTGRAGENGELTAHDRHAQAALILSMCERVLPAIHMAYVRVQFGREASGFELLTHHVAANFGTGLHSRRSIEQIIRAYCGEKIGLREIRKSMSCGMLKAVSYRNQAYDALDAIHLQAMDRLREEMEKRGLLQGAGTTAGSR
jgi:hypothetical protein